MPSEIRTLRPPVEPATVPPGTSAAPTPAAAPAAAAPPAAPAERDAEPHDAEPHDADPAGAPPVGSVTRPGRSPGRIGYALAWLAALGLGGTAIALRFGTPQPRLTITIAVGAAALIGAVALHLAAVGANRHRDTGLAVAAAGMVLLLLPALAVATVVAAAAGNPGTLTWTPGVTDLPAPDLPPFDGGFDDLPQEPALDDTLPDGGLPPEPTGLPGDLPRDEMAPGDPIPEPVG